MYVQRLAEEGFQERLEQLFLDLLGPTYPLPAASSHGSRSNARSVLTYGKDGRWDAMVAGLQKRKLLREALEVTGKFRELQSLNVQYDTALRDLEDQDVMIID